jgi:two-component system, OmpR family, alkaline phosphatase synthesis response regulator PhoP
MKKILLVEDERAIAGIVRDALENSGFLVLIAKDGPAGLELALKEDPDLVILDIALPGMDGFEVCRRIKKKKLLLPVIMLTAMTAEADKIMGLELGADDYMTKPFSVKELIARINTCLRPLESHQKAKADNTQSSQFGDIKIDFVQMEAFKNNKKVSFTKKEYDILRYLIKRRKEVVSRNDLLDVIWGFEESPLTRTVDTFMSRIRKKIEDNPAQPKYLKSIRSAGYKLDI